MGKWGICMIATVTVNPSLDDQITLDRLTRGRVNRAAGADLVAGGKGFNISTILSELGAETTAFGFVGGFVGAEIARQCEAKFPCEFVKIRENNRINIKLAERSEDASACVTEVNSAGPFITPEEYDALTDKIFALSSDDMLVLAGSLPPTLPKTCYADWLAALSKTAPGMTTVVDATGEALLDCLAYAPFLIKPNHHELGEIFGVTIDSRASAAKYGQMLQEKGARNVLISMAAEGAVLCTENGEIYTQDTLRGDIVSDVGAGDSMLAGFLFAWQKTHDYTYALKYGTAAGAATTFSAGLADAAHIETLFRRLS